MVAKIKVAKVVMRRRLGRSVPTPWDSIAAFRHIDFLLLSPCPAGVGVGPGR
jgi:hypothetical protein